MELKEKYTIVMVTHNMQQAARISDKTAFFLLGKMIEYDEYRADCSRCQRINAPKITLQEGLVNHENKI